MRFRTTLWLLLCTGLLLCAVWFTRQRLEREDADPVGFADRYSAIKHRLETRQMVTDEEYQKKLRGEDTSDKILRRSGVIDWLAELQNKGKGY